MRKLLIITLLSFNINAHADVFDDIGNFMADNKALTAVLSVTALSVAGVAMKPIGEFLAEDAAATDFMVADRIYYFWCCTHVIPFIVAYVLQSSECHT
jgi:hypothetical protein